VNKLHVSITFSKFSWVSEL